MDERDIGQELRDAVVAAGGQAAVAKAAKISRPHLANWIAGRSQLASKSLVRVWRATGERFDLAAAAEHPGDADGVAGRDQEAAP